jgi:hypothetical protein
MYTYRITGHFGNYGSSAAAFVDREDPFFSRRMYSFAISTNYRHRKGHRFMRRLTERINPLVASLEMYPWRGPAEPIRIRNAHRFIPYYTDLGRRAANKVSRKVTGRLIFPGKPEDSRAHSAASSLLQYARESHSGGLRLSELRTGSLYESTRLKHFLESAEHPTFRGSTLLGRFLTAELALDLADSDLGD